MCALWKKEEEGGTLQKKVWFAKNLLTSLLIKKFSPHFSENHTFLNGFLFVYDDPKTQDFRTWFSVLFLHGG